MRTNKNRTVLIVIIALIILILGAGSVGAYLYIKTDIFKTNQQLFSKYIGQTLDEIEEVIEINTIQKINKKISENSIESETEMFLQSDSIKDLEKNILTVTVQDDKDNQKRYNNIKLVNGEESLMQVEYMTTQNSISLRLTDVVKQFLTVENRDLTKLSENLQLEEQQLKQILNLLQYQEQSNLLEITDEEKDTLKTTYMNIVLDNLTKDNFTKQKNAMVTINGNTITTNSYTLTISPEQVKVILQKMVEQLKNDEIILSKIDKLEEEQQDFFALLGSEEENSLKQYYIEYLDEILEQINDQENEEIKVTLYEQEGKNVRVKIEEGFYTITIDSLVNDEMLGINAKIVSLENANENKIEINLTKYKNEDYNLSIEIESYENEDENIVLEIKATDSENNINLEIVAGVVIEGESTKAVLKSNIDIVDEITNMIDLDKANNITLNDLTPEKCKQILEAVGKATVETYKEEIDAITQLTMLYMASEKIESVDLSETEKNQFNSKFEPYEGENVSGAQVNALMRMVLNNNLAEEENNKRVKVIGDITLDINDTSLPETKGDTAKTYTVEMQYNESTGLINSIRITEN